MDNDLYNTLQKEFDNTDYSLIMSLSMCLFYKKGSTNYFHAVKHNSFNRKHLLECIKNDYTRFHRDEDLNNIMKNVLCRKRRIKRLLEEI